MNTLMQHVTMNLSTINIINQHMTAKLVFYIVEKPAEAGSSSLGGRLKLCEGDTRI